MSINQYKIDYKNVLHVHHGKMSIANDIMHWIWKNHTSYISMSPIKLHSKEFYVSALNDRGMLQNKGMLKENFVCSGKDMVQLHRRLDLTM